MNDDATPAAVPAATPSSSVILARDGDDGLEFLMVRRHRNVAFGSADAFPGGKLNADDAEVEALCCGVDATEANRRLNIADRGLAYHSAAIRELFEETGVLLAQREGHVGIVIIDGLERERAKLALGTLSWPGFLRDRSFVLRTDALHYVSHWEAPVHIRPRFATRFFIAVAPRDQPVRADGTEVVDSRWLPPSRALRMGDDGELNLPFPTRKILESLAGFTNLPDLLQWATNRWQRGVTRMSGKLVEEGGVTRVVLPGEPGYPEDRA